MANLISLNEGPLNHKLAGGGNQNANTDYSFDAVRSRGVSAPRHDGSQRRFRKRDQPNPFVKMLWERGSLYEREVIAGLKLPFLDLSG